MAEREYTISIKASADSLKQAFAQASSATAEFLAGVKEGFSEQLQVELRKGEAEMAKFGDTAKKAGDESANAGKKAEQAGEDAARGGQKALSSWDSIALKITGLVSSFDLAGRAMSAIGSSIEAVFAGISRGADLDDLSQRLGVAVEQLSSLELAATLGGVSMDAMGTGMQALSRSMAAAASGSKEAQAAFEAVGIKAGEISNLRTDEVLERIADRFAGAQDGADKTALAMDLLGKAGAQLIPVLNAGSDGLEKNAQLAQQLGLVLDGETAQAMGNAADAVDILGLSVTGVQNQIAAGMAPALSRAADMVVDFVANVGIADGRLQNLGNVIGTTVADSIESLIALFDRLSTAANEGRFADALLAELQRIGPAVEPVARDIGIKIGGWIAEGVKSAFRIDWAALMEGAAAAAPKGGDPFAEWANSRKQAVQGAFDLDVAPLASSVDGVAGAFSRLQQAEAEAAAQTVAANTAYSSTHKVIGQMADGTLILGESLIKSGESAKKGAIGYQANGDAAKKAADEVEQLRERFEEQIRTQTETVEKMQGQNEALQQIIDGNLSAEQAQSLLNDATGEAAAVAALATGATAEEATALGNLAISAAEAAQKNRELNATRNAQVQTGYLREERDILEQVVAGTKDRITAEHEIAVIRERRKGTDAEIAESYVKEQEAVDAVREKYEKLGKTGEDAWQGIDNAFQQTIDGFINGTLQMDDIWKSFTAGLLNDFVKSMGGVSGIFEKIAGGAKGLFTGNAGQKDENGNPIDFLTSIGGGTARFQDASGNTDYGAVAGAAVQGGATAYSLFQPTSDTKLEGLIAKGTEAGVINASNAIGQVVGTIAGAVLSIYLGPLGGIVGAAVGSALSGLIAGSVNRQTFLTGDYTGFVGFQQTFDPFHAWLTDLVLNLPTLGLAMRKGAEAVLDESETFKALQSKFGDITVRSGGPEGVYRNNLTGSDTARARGWSAGQVDLTEGATAAIFGQIAEGEMPEDAGRLGEAMGRIMAEFLSRGMEEGVDFEPMFDKLREFAHEAGIDLFSTMRKLDEVMQQSMAAGATWGKLDPFANSEQGARAYAEALVGAAAVFKGDFPAGVNTTAIALRYLEKDGVNAFGNIDAKAKETLLNLSQDTELTMETVQKLVSAGFRINTDEFQRAMSGIAQSAAFIGENIGQVFAAPSVFAGIESMGQKLRDTIKGAVFSTATEQLFDKTRIAESFSPVYEVLDKLKNGDFDLTDAVGADSFKNQMIEAIATGKATLQEYIPQLRAIRDTAEEVDKAIEEALKPTEAEVFWQNISETFESNKDAIEGMAEGMFEVAVQAERAGAGLGQQATRDAMSSQIDQGIFTATQAAVSTTAGDSPEAQRLAALTTEFQFKVQAALKDGVVSGAELADLTALKAKMHEAGEQVADGISSGAEQLDSLFRADRLKESIDAATASLKDSVGSAAGSMFDVIKGGGSVEEGVKAFGEGFRSSVRDNVLQGMQEALVQSVIMEGALGTLMGQLKQAVSVAMEDGMIDANEQQFIDGLAKGIGQATDNAITQLEPTVRALGGVAETVAGNTDKAEKKLDDLNDQTKKADYGVDEMARRAAKNLENVGDAVQSDTTDAIKEGLGALKGAVGNTDATNEIADGVGALKDALGGAAGGPATEIQAGIGALRDALGDGTSGPAGDIGAGIDKLQVALGDGTIDPIESGLLKMKDALGDGAGSDGLVSAAELAAGALNGNGSASLTAAADAVTGALGAAGANGVVGAAGDAADALKNQLQANAEDLASQLGGSFRTGLDDAETAARSFADKVNALVLGDIPGRANGGPVPAGTMAFVGERGPELILAHPGGGVSVMPLDNVPGYANGTGDIIPIHVRGGGPPHVPPPPGTHPPSRNPDANGEDVTLNVSFNFTSALDDFFRGGSRKDLRDALAETTGEGILQGMMDAMLKKAGLEAFQEQMASTIEKAMEDGTLSASELEGIEKMGKDFKAKLVAMADELGPAFATIAEAFGIDIGQEVEDAITPAAQSAKDLIGSSLRSALRDPANLNYETFSASLRQAVYGNIVDGMVDAFINAAVIQGALAPMLAVISSQFENLGKAIAAGSADGIAAASAIILTEVGKIANIVDDPAFKAAIKTLLDLGHDVAKGLGVDLNTAAAGVNTAADGFQSAADAAANACTGECDAEQKLVTTNEKLIALDTYGRTGGVTDSYYANASSSGTSGVDDGIPNTLGGGNGEYGFTGSDADWRHAQRWDRRQDRFLRDHPDWRTTHPDPGDNPYFGRGYRKMATGGIVTEPTFALIGEAGPEAVVPLSGAESTSDLVRELRALRDEFREELRNHGDKTVSALEADRHTEVKMNEQTLIDAWTSAKRVADKAGIQFGA